MCAQAGDPDHYACIGVTHDATADELRRAYRKVSLASHPDKPGGSEEAFSRVSAAYKVLDTPLVLACRRPTRSPTCKPGTPAVNLAPDAVFASCPHPEPPKEARTKREARRREPLACRAHPEPQRRHCFTRAHTVSRPGAERRAHAARLRRGQRRRLAGARRGGRAARAGRARDPPSPECAVGCRPVAPTVRPGRHPAFPSRSRSSSTRSASPSGPSATRSRSTRSSCSSVSACVCARRAREPRSGCAATRPSGRSCGASELCLTLPLLHECPVLSMYFR